MPKFQGLMLPSIVEIDSFEKDETGQTNDVYLCRGRFRKHEARFVLKVSKRADLEIFNEYRTLEAISRHGPLAPKPLFKGESGGRAYIVVEYIEGRVIWDHVDPQRPEYKARERGVYLERYGETLARIHALPLKLHVQKRATLYNDFRRRIPRDGEFSDLFLSLENRAIPPRDRALVFTHGDYNVSNVHVADRRVTGVLDWEFAGKGWKEYDIAYAIRARQTFLDKSVDRDSVLRGYQREGDFDEAHLRWCEALNYLYYAQRARDVSPVARDFNLARARQVLD